MPSRYYWYLIVLIMFVLVDELAYYWWRKLHPGSHWHGVFGKNQLQTWEDDMHNDFPNGFRPGGGLG